MTTSPRRRRLQREVKGKAKNEICDGKNKKKERIRSQHTLPFDKEVRNGRGFNLGQLCANERALRSLLAVVGASRKEAPPTSL